VAKSRDIAAVENDASPPSLDSSVSFWVTSIVTQYEHQAHKEEDTEDVLIEDPKPDSQV